MIDKEGVEPQALCGLCHSLDGVSRMSKFPKLAGQKAAYIKKQFLDFHAGRRANDGGQMSGITREIDTAAIDGVAQYFAQLPAPPATVLPDDSAAQAQAQQGADLFFQGREGLAPLRRLSWPASAAYGAISLAGCATRYLSRQAARGF